jgi:hypothetical protein
VVYPKGDVTEGLNETQVELFEELRPSRVWSGDDDGIADGFSEPLSQTMILDASHDLRQCVAIISPIMFAARGSILQSLRMTMMKRNLEVANRD